MRRALCVGIDAYPFGSLRGCVSDAERMAGLLARHEDGSPNFDCRTIVAPGGAGYDVVTRAKLKQAVSQLFRDKADVALLYFAGHGTENNLGGYLVTQDAKTYDEGMAMHEILALANDSKADEAVIILDCCHAGNIGNVPAVDNMKAVLREGISILAASRSGQESVETNGGGVFTSLVAGALEGGAADILGEVTAPAIYSLVEGALGAWDQRPLFKSHVSKVVPLRECAPAVPTAILRELPSLFPVPAEDLPLDPSYEKSSPSPDAINVEKFEKLQALNRAYLVIPCGAAHMYNAAVNSQACRLTASGRYYWRLAESHRI